MVATQQDVSAVAQWIDRVSRVVHTVDASLELVGNALHKTSQLVLELREDSLQLARETERLCSVVALTSPAIAETLRSTPRMARIVKEAARMVAGYRIHSKQALFLSPDVAAARLEALHERNAVRLRDLCMELGGGILKAGQFLSCRVDMLPDAYVKHLTCLQDQAPPVDTDTIRARIEEELGRPLEEVYLEFDDQPLATASLAQVHAARLLDGLYPLASQVDSRLERLAREGYAADAAAGAGPRPWVPMARAPFRAFAAEPMLVTELKTLHPSDVQRGLEGGSGGGGE